MSMDSVWKRAMCKRTVVVEFIPHYPDPLECHIWFDMSMNQHSPLQQSFMPGMNHTLCSKVDIINDLNEGSIIFVDHFERDAIDCEVCKRILKSRPLAVYEGRT